MCCHGPGAAQRSAHHLPVQRLIWPGLPVLVQLVWQIARRPCALIVDILLACSQERIPSFRVNGSIWYTVQMLALCPGYVLSPNILPPSLGMLLWRLQLCQEDYTLPHRRRPPGRIHRDYPMSSRRLCDGGPGVSPLELHQILQAPHQTPKTLQP